jgi:hypothetical protein
MDPESDELSLSPRERIKRLYCEFKQPRSFEEDERLHRMTGYVIETEDAFVMGRPVKHDVAVEAIACPHVSFAPEICDAWFIWAFAGNIKSLLEIVEVVGPLPFLGWSRRNGTIRWYRYKETRRRVAGLSQITIVPRRT